MPRSNVVITGMGVVSAIGIGCDAFFRALLEGKSGITSLANRTDEGARPGEPAEPAGLWVGGPILDFDAKQYVRPRKALKVMCREIQTAFAASQMAIDSGGLSELLPADPQGKVLPSEVGTVFGSEMFYGPPTEMEDSIRACLQEDGSFDPRHFGAAAMKQITPLWMLKYLPNMPACHVGIALNAHGPNNSVILGDVSGSAALIEAASYLERGIASLMIAGGTGTRINTTRLNYRGDLPIPEAFDPIEFSSRPHDPTSKGVVGGEGAASLLLETAEHASQRGVKPIARIVAYASRFVPSDGMKRSIRSSDPSDLGARGSSHAIRLAMETAIADAGIAAEQIGLVVSHGIGDPSSDAAEREATEATVPGIPMLATVASLGHTGAASSMIDLLAAALSLTNDVVPPTIFAESLSPDANFVSKPEPLRGDHVLCLAHNSEGNAMAVILGRP